ncbi:hypothetical protein CFOL_v3_27751 [Cephalotus follicularis]|uniref:Uncharacterized protein n=1 Tax=Cephalotus follicularis TaxID=3775 RepID=A0A1Q3CVQ8_CEPFO|nr:hypothetical protein CFOL_v3_27751 [Cephalotus follicularis]
MDIHSMKRKELQALCKKHSIPANLTNREMADLLASVFKEGEKSFPQGKHSLNNGIEMAAEIESSKVIMKKVKKVRFSPENETHVFEKLDMDSGKDYIPPKKKLRARGKSMVKPMSKKQVWVIENTQSTGISGKVLVSTGRTRSQTKVVEGSVNVELSPPVGKKSAQRGTNIDNIQVKSVEVSGKPKSVLELGQVRVIEKGESSELPGKFVDSRVRIRAQAKAVVEGGINVVLSPSVGKKRARRGAEIENIEVKSFNVSDKQQCVVELGHVVEALNSDVKVSEGLDRRHLRTRKVVAETSKEEGLGVSRKSVRQRGSTKRVKAKGSGVIVLLDMSSKEEIKGVVDVEAERTINQGKQNVTKDNESAVLNKEYGEPTIVGRITRSRNQLKGKASAVESEAISIQVQEESEKVAKKVSSQKSVVHQKGRVVNEIVDEKVAKPGRSLRRSKRNVVKGNVSALTRNSSAILSYTVPADGDLGTYETVGKAEQLTEPSPGKNAFVTEKQSRLSRRNASRQNSRVFSTESDGNAVVEKSVKLKQRREPIVNEETPVADVESQFEKPIRRSTRIDSKHSLYAPARITGQSFAKKPNGRSKVPVIITETPFAGSILATEELAIEDAALALPEAAGNNDNKDSNYRKAVPESSKNLKKSRSKSSAKKQLSSVKVSTVHSHLEEVINVTESLVESPVVSPLKFLDISTRQETLNPATETAVLNEKSSLVVDEKEKSLSEKGVDSDMEEPSPVILSKGGDIDNHNSIDLEQVRNEDDDGVSCKITSLVYRFLPPNQLYSAGEPSDLLDLEKELKTEEPSSLRSLNPRSNLLNCHSTEDDKMLIQDDQNSVQSEDAHQIAEQVVQDKLSKSTCPESNPDNPLEKAEELSAQADQAELLVEATELRIVTSKSKLVAVENDVERIAKIKLSSSGHHAPVVSLLKVLPESQETNQPKAHHIAQPIMLGSSANHFSECLNHETEILDGISCAGDALCVLEKLEDDKMYEHEEACCFERASVADDDEMADKGMECCKLPDFDKTGNLFVEKKENLVSEGIPESCSKEASGKYNHELSVGEGILPATQEEKDIDRSNAVLQPSVIVGQRIISVEQILLKYNDEYEQVFAVGNKPFSWRKASLSVEKNVQEREENQPKNHVSSSVTGKKLIENSEALLKEPTCSIQSDVDVDEKEEVKYLHYEETRDVVKGRIQPECLPEFALEKFQDGVEGESADAEEISDEVSCVCNTGDSSGARRFLLEESTALSHSEIRSNKYNVHETSLNEDVVSGNSVEEVLDVGHISLIKVGGRSVSEEVRMQGIGGADTKLTEAICKSSGISESIGVALNAAECIERINMLKVEEMRPECKSFDANEVKFHGHGDHNEEMDFEQDKNATLASDSIIRVDDIAANKKPHEAKLDSDLNLNDCSSDGEVEGNIDATPPVTLNNSGDNPVEEELLTVNGSDHYNILNHGCVDIRAAANEAGFVTMDGKICSQDKQVEITFISPQERKSGKNLEENSAGGKLFSDTSSGKPVIGSGNDIRDTDLPVQAVDEVAMGKNVGTSEEIGEKKLDHEGAVKNAGAHKLDDMVVTGDDSGEFLNFENLSGISSSQPETAFECSILRPPVACSNSQNFASEFQVESPTFSSWEMNFILERDEVERSYEGILESHLSSQECKDAMEVKEIAVISEQEDQLVAVMQPDDQMNQTLLTVTDESISDGCEGTNEKDDVSSNNKQFTDRENHEDVYVEAHVSAHNVIANSKTYSASDKPLAECNPKILKQDYIANLDVRNLFGNSSHTKLSTGGKWEESLDKIKSFPDSSCGKPEIGSSNAAISWSNVPASYEEGYNPDTYQMEVNYDARGKEKTGEGRDMIPLFQQDDSLTMEMNVDLQKDNGGLCDATYGSGVEDSQEAAQDQPVGGRDAFEATIMDGTAYHSVGKDEGKSHVAEAEAARLHKLDGEVVITGDTLEVVNTSYVFSAKPDMAIDCIADNDPLDMDTLFEDVDVTKEEMVGALKDGEGVDDATDGFRAGNHDLDAKDAAMELLGDLKDVAVGASDFSSSNKPIYGSQSKISVAETEELHALHRLDDNVVTAGDTTEVADFENLDCVEQDGMSAMIQGSMDFKSHRDEPVKEKVESSQESSRDMKMIKVAEISRNHSFGIPKPAAGCDFNNLEADRIASAGIVDPNLLVEKNDGEYIGEAMESSKDLGKLDVTMVDQSPAAITNSGVGRDNSANDGHRFSLQKKSLDAKNEESRSLFAEQSSASIVKTNNKRSNVTKRTPKRSVVQDMKENAARNKSEQISNATALLKRRALEDLRKN